MLGQVFDRFVEKAPVAVMVRGILERALSADALNGLFERVADRQYTRELLFSSVFELMNLVVCKIQPSIHAAYHCWDRSHLLVQHLSLIYLASISETDDPCHHKQEFQK